LVRPHATKSPISSLGRFPGASMKTIITMAEGIQAGKVVVSKEVSAAILSQPKRKSKTS